MPLDALALVKRCREELDAAIEAKRRRDEELRSAAAALEAAGHRDEQPEWCIIVTRRTRRDIARRRRGGSHLTRSIHPCVPGTTLKACALIETHRTLRASVLSHPGVYRVVTDALLID